MYGLIGQLQSVPGQRARLVELLSGSSEDMPGCLSYVIALDPEDENAIWITEAWDSAESHLASLDLPQVQAAIAEARPIIAGFGHRFETEPVSGLPTK
jgi:quinol monooxygenase YgiN